MLYSCKSCGVDVEEVGGIQLNSCQHFLCGECLVKEANACSGPRILCDPRPEPQKRCNGFMDITELEYMIPDKDYSELLYRIAQAADGSGDQKPNEVAVVKHEALAQVAAAVPPVAVEESVSGWDQKAALVHQLTEVCGMTPNHAYEYIDALPIMENSKPMPCMVCLDDNIPPGDGIILKDCCHTFCKQCLGAHVKAMNKAEVTCPYGDGDYQCAEALKPSEIRALVDAAEYKRHFEDLAINEAATTMPDVFHCLTPDCKGFCVVHPDSLIFRCPICKARNCIQCKAIHDGTCEDFKNKDDDDANRALQKLNDEKSVAEIKRRLDKKLWMRCPKCNTVIEKNGGCHHMYCTKCKHNFNWKGKGKRGLN